ncbi:MAG: glutamine synthetase III [Eubacteriales bacterium]|nr:glutamine synthetase III [Eubacteriales bacterium]
MNNIPEIFGCMVFNDNVMKERLPQDTYKALKKTIEEGKSLDLEITSVVASAMKDWAIEKGATHFTHWFQPLTGITAEKHDSFITPTDDSNIIMEFSGKELVKGESDASSFPSGGLRATFEARGYTAWDPTSYAFIKDNTLCIPTAFCSYGGESLDKKTPLLRSMEEVGKQALRLVKICGNTGATSVTTTVGAEQEYFLIDTELYNQRKDLVFTGRTLFGAKAPKDQQMDDHYFGIIKPRIKAFMEELDIELWKLGILAKTEHNEVAPAQHELAPIYTTTNFACDHNQLTMELMKKIAKKHGLTCLLHEKPFAGINGSGKHNNWALSTNTGENLLNPTKEPENNIQFLLFLAAVIEAVDKHQGLLRASVASAGNDHRLGASEAPPAIISMFLGDELYEILDTIRSEGEYEHKKANKMSTGATVLPSFKKDTTDRNRTSPMAFTGNKFELRMLGSSFSISDPNVVLNTIVAESLENLADKLEGTKNIMIDGKKAVKAILDKHWNIIFNGNNYAEEWVEEAEKRGLLNLKTTPDALPYLIKEESIEVFKKHGIFTETELHSRYEILIEEYSKTISIEALTLCEMVKREIIPVLLDYSGRLASIAAAKTAVCKGIPTTVETSLINRLSEITIELYNKIAMLDSAVAQTNATQENTEKANTFKNTIVPALQIIREYIDEAETMVSAEFWPYPTYGDLLFNI